SSPAPRLSAPCTGSQLCLWITDRRATLSIPSSSAMPGTCGSSQWSCSLCWHWSLPTVPPQIWTGLARLAILGGRRITWSRRHRESAVRDGGHAGSSPPLGHVGSGGARRVRSGPVHRSVQVPGGGVCGCRLCGVLLGLPQLGHGSGEGDQVRDQ